MATVNNEDPRMVSHEQMLRRGLRVAQAHVGNQKHKAVIGDFKSHYGIHPKQCARVWKDLIERNIIEDGEEDLLGFFAALSFLKEYDREKKRRGIFKMAERQEAAARVDMALGGNFGCTQAIQNCLAK